MAQLQLWVDGSHVIVSVPTSCCCLKVPTKQKQNFSLQNLKKMFSPSFIIFRIQRLIEGKQYRSR